MKYKCIIFDCDGVLVDSEQISSKVLVDLANSIGADIDMDYAEVNFTGKSFESVFEHIETIGRKKLPHDYERHYRTQTFELFRSELQPIKGIHDLLDKISVPYCVASNGPLDKMLLNLSITNLLDRFENSIFSAYQINKWKPDPALFLYAAKEMGFSPSECVVIEDSIAGIKAARSGGFDVFGFANKHNSKIFKDEGAEVFYKMDDLLEQLKSH